MSALLCRQAWALMRSNSVTRHTMRARPVTVCVYSSQGGAGLVARIKEDMKAAMKSKEKERLDAIRMINAAIKQASREIELRESGATGGADIGDAEVVKVVQRLAKQRKDSIEQYQSGGRDDLAAKEMQELALLESYLPAQMSRDDLALVVDEVVASLGATSPKQMGAVMKAVLERVAGSADGKMVSELVKQKLS